MTAAMKPFLRGASLALGCGYILYFWSETVFWSSPLQGDSLVSVVGGWLLYSSAALLLLCAAERLRAAGIWSILLLGAVFGWVVEGVYAMTVYGDGGIAFPLTLSWTALAWHALLSVFAGLFGLRRALQARRAWPGLAVSAALGVFWGFWAHGWQMETPPLAIPPMLFFAYAAGATAALALAQTAVNFGTAERFHPSRLIVAASAGLPAFYFCAVTVPHVIWSPAVLPPLLGLSIYALSRARSGPAEVAALESFGRPVTLRSLARLAPLPAAAASVYGLLGLLPQPLPALQITALLSGTAGAVAFAAALWKTLRRGPAAGVKGGT
jgi:hypothetical protein